MSIKKAIATGMFLQTKHDDTIDFLTESIASTFSMLANLDPNTALFVIQQLSEQFDEEIAEEQSLRIKESIEEVSSHVNITEFDLENEE